MFFRKRNLFNILATMYPIMSENFLFLSRYRYGFQDLMQIKLIEENEVNCKVNKEKNRLTASNGKYTGEQSSGSCGDSYWICNQKNPLDT